VPDYTQLEYALNRINFIYKYEEIHLAIRKIAQNYHWKLSELPHLNSSKQTDFEIDDRDIHNIKSINYLDDYIYNRTPSLIADTGQ
jgi:hypothetical protein